MDGGIGVGNEEQEEDEEKESSGVDVKRFRDFGYNNVKFMAKIVKKLFFLIK